MNFRTLDLLLKCSKEFSHPKIHTQNLSDTEGMICSYVYSHAGCTQDDIAKALKTDKTTIAKALAALEKKNCVMRKPDESDRRKNNIYLTDTGSEKISRLINIHNEWLSEVLTCLSEKEQKEFEDYCERLLASAETLAEKYKTGGNDNA